MSDRAIASWVERGRLHRVHWGVYSVGHRALSQEGRWMAAVLAAGPHAVLSHRSAAHLWGLIRRSPFLADATSPRTKRRIRGVNVHRTRRLEPGDVTRHRNIPTTTVARTLVDLAEHTTEGELRRALHQAEVSYSLTSPEVSAAAIHGRRHTANLKEPPDRSRSALERAFQRLCRRQGIEQPENNVMVAGLEVDFAWRAQRLVVELDGWRYHRGREAFERDRARDAALARAGWRVLRFTYAQIANEGELVAAAIKAARD